MTTIVHSKLTPNNNICYLTEPVFGSLLHAGCGGYDVTKLRTAEATGAEGLCYLTLYPDTCGEMNSLKADADCERQATE
ncbi:hypothetical protein PENSPDRAFT_503864 [Peniophora sp. CONT]|nr:hypothetical protein PENSPDRAFT_503864 [Peniophora sp. CONT]